MLSLYYKNIRMHKNMFYSSRSFILEVLEYIILNKILQIDSKKIQIIIN